MTRLGKGQVVHVSSAHSVWEAVVLRETRTRVLVAAESRIGSESGVRVGAAGAREPGGARVRAVELVVVPSTTHPGLLSLRTPAAEDAPTATSIRRALVVAGFQAGERVYLVPAAELAHEVLIRDDEEPARWPADWPPGWFEVIL